MSNVDYRDYVLEGVENGLFDPEHLLFCCLKYMSQDDVKDMLEINEYPLWKEGNNEACKLHDLKTNSP